MSTSWFLELFPRGQGRTLVNFIFVDSKRFDRTVVQIMSCRIFYFSNVMQSFGFVCPGCEYGDRVTWCESQELDAKSCSKDSDLGKKCCGTCSKKQFTGAGTNNVDVQEPGNGGSATCPQGDTADWCATMEPHKCYTSKSTCCSTCEKLAASVGGERLCYFGLCAYVASRFHGAI